MCHDFTSTVHTPNVLDSWETFPRDIAAYSFGPLSVSKGRVKVRYVSRPMAARRNIRSTVSPPFPMSKKEHTFQTKLSSDCPVGGGSRFSRLYIISGALCCANQHLSPPVLAAASQGDQKVNTFYSLLLCAQAMPAIYVTACL